jgi:hypothetical protein
MLAILAVVGVAIVGGGAGIGDALSFAQPIGFGMRYLQWEELMRKKPEASLPVSAVVQLRLPCWDSLKWRPS